MNNGRDCAHGRQVGKCDTCDLIDAEQRILELEAQVEQLKPLARRCLWGAVNWNDHNFEPLHKYLRKSAADAGVFTVDQANELLERTPAQCLSKIKAQAVVGAIDAHKNRVMTFGFDTAIRVSDLVRYANQLRQQAKG